MISFLAEARDLPVTDFQPHLYQFNDLEACRHLFRVASGLDSMVLGEDQIVNQLKNAYNNRQPAENHRSGVEPAVPSCVWGWQARPRHHQYFRWETVGFLRSP